MIPGLGRSPREGIGILGLPCGSAGKESACNAGDLGSIPGLGKATHSSILAWRIPWKQEPGRLYSPWVHKELDMIVCVHTHTGLYVAYMILRMSS